MSEENTEKQKSDNSSKADRKKKARLFSWRNVKYALAFVGLLFFVLAGVVVGLYQSGYIENYIKEQFVVAFDEMGITFKSDQFTVTASPLNLTVKNATFTNKKTGQKIARIGDLDLAMTIVDLYAISTERNVDIITSDLNDVEVWVDFDKDGKSNFAGIEILPPKNNVKFQYSSAKVSLRNSVVHLGDLQRSVSGELKNLVLFIENKSAENPEGKDRYRFSVSAAESELRYDASKINPVFLMANGVFDDLGAEISELKLTTPLGESNLHGTIKTWSMPKYDLKIKSKVDLAQTSQTFPIGTPIDGSGNFEGTVKGEGEKYRVEGEINSDSLAASNVSLKALKLNGDVEGRNTAYRGHGKAIAELLTFGDFKIDLPRLSGNVRGTGTDFRWFGELRSAAVRSPLGSLAGLYISDAIAEYKDRRFNADFRNFGAKEFSSPGARVYDPRVDSIKVSFANGSTQASVPNARASKVDVEGASLYDVSVRDTKVNNRNAQTDLNSGSVSVKRVETKDARLNNVSADGVVVRNRGGQTDVVAKNVRSDEVETSAAKLGDIQASDVDVNIVGNDTIVYSNNVKIARVSSDAAVLGNLNIAGVRFSVRDGRVEAQSDDFNAGDVDLPESGKLTNVKVMKPVFVLEPSGRYRASLDMSLGGGTVGSIALGAAKASVVANNDQIELSNLSAQVMDGDVAGTATIATNQRSRSSVNVDFTDVDLGKILALQGGQVVPIEGKTTGRADLTFAGTDFNRSSGTLTADILANAGSQDRGVIPLTGKLGVRATDGLFDIDYANLRTQQTTFDATGRFDLNGEDSNLDIAVNSSDAAEVERLVRVLDLSEDLQQQLDTYEAAFAGNFNLAGKLTGNLNDPLFDGRAALDTVIVRGNDLGSFRSDIARTGAALELRNGLLKDRSSGSIAFNVLVPNTGSNNINVNAKLDRINLANLIVVLPVDSVPQSLRDLQAETSGDLNLSGLPSEMRGQANLVSKEGKVNGQTFDSLESKVLFDGTLVNIEKFDAEFGSGVLRASGKYETDTTRFDFTADGNGIPVSRLLAFAPKDAGIPEIKGAVNVNATASGNTSNSSTYDINFKGVGRSVTVNDASFGNVNFEGETVNQRLDAKITTRFRGQSQLITANVNFADENLPLEARTDLDKTRLDPYIAIFRKPDPNSIAIGGTATGNVLLRGNLTEIDSNGKRVFTTNNLAGTARFSQFDLQIDEAPLNATKTVDISFDANEIFIDDARFAGGGTNLIVSGTKALRDDGINNLSVDGKINLRVLNALSRNIFFSGIADLGIRLTGVNRTSRLNGTARAENASVSTFIGSERLTFERLKGLVLFTTNQVQIDEITGFLGGGKMTMTGGASLNDRLQLDRFRFEVFGNNITARLPKDFTTTGNADVEINGRRRGDSLDTLISGTFYAKRSVYRKDIDLADLISGRRETSLSQSSATTTNFVPKLDLRVLGRNSLSVRNNLADLTASTDLRVTGDIDFPQISGRITANSGRLFFSDDRYELQRGVITFPPNTAAIEPIVALQAETEISGYQVFVSLNGNVVNSESLVATVRSNPALPQADVISLITTGSLSNTGSGIPTLAQSGLNTATEILTDEIINRPISRATDRLFGLNKFALDPIVSGIRRNPTARLTVGRQINRNLLVTYSTNLSQDQNQVLAFEYRLSNRLSFVAQYEQRSLSNVTRNRDTFSFEIRLRKRF